MSKYKQEFDLSISHRDEYWGQAAKLVHWEKPWDKVLDDSNKPYYRWYTGAEVNTCYNASTCMLMKAGVTRTRSSTIPP